MFMTVTSPKTDPVEDQMLGEAVLGQEAGAEVGRGVVAGLGGDEARLSRRLEDVAGKGDEGVAFLAVGMPEAEFASSRYRWAAEGPFLQPEALSAPVSA